MLIKLLMIIFTLILLTFTIFLFKKNTIQLGNHKKYKISKIWKYLFIIITIISIIGIFNVIFTIIALISGCLLTMTFGFQISKLL